MLIVIDLLLVATRCIAVRHQRLDWLAVFVAIVFPRRQEQLPNFIRVKRTHYRLIDLLPQLLHHVLRLARVVLVQKDLCHRIVDQLRLDNLLLVLLDTLALHTSHGSILTYALSVDAHSGVEWIIWLIALVELKYLGFLVTVLVLRLGRARSDRILLRGPPLDHPNLTLMSFLIVIIHDWRCELVPISFKNNVILALACVAVLSLQTGSSGPVGQVGLLFLLCGAADTFLHWTDSEHLSGCRATFASPWT